MGGVSLLAASLVVALLGFGWLNALKEGVFDFLGFFRGGDRTEEMMEMKDDDAMMEDELDIEGDIEADPEFDDELNGLEDELDALLQETEAELDSLEGEL